MKIFRVLLIFFIVLIINLTQPCGLKAQSSLQFNQAILVSTSQTVPVGMVWKVESVIASNQLAPGLAYNVNAGATKSIVILINGSNAYVKTWDEKNYWLPAGTTLEASTNTLYISVLEFKISP
jgi:hypothetical protein